MEESLGRTWSVWFTSKKSYYDKYLIYGLLNLCLGPCPVIYGCSSWFTASCTTWTHPWWEQGTEVPVKCGSVWVCACGRVSTDMLQGRIQATTYVMLFVESVKNETYFYNKRKQDGTEWRCAHVYCNYELRDTCSTIERETHAAIRDTCSTIEKRKCHGDVMVLRTLDSRWFEKEPLNCMGEGDVDERKHWTLTRKKRALGTLVKTGKTCINKDWMQQKYYDQRVRWGETRMKKVIKGQTQRDETNLRPKVSVGYVGLSND